MTVVISACTSGPMTLQKGWPHEGANWHSCGTGPDVGGRGAPAAREHVHAGLKRSPFLKARWKASAQNILGGRCRPRVPQRVAPAMADESGLQVVVFTQQKWRDDLSRRRNLLVAPGQPPTMDVARGNAKSCARRPQGTEPLMSPSWRCGQAGDRIATEEKPTLGKECVVVSSGCKDRWDPAYAAATVLRHGNPS